jgi:hypothetical protein
MTTADTTMTMPLLGQQQAGPDAQPQPAAPPAEQDAPAPARRRRGGNSPLVYLEVWLATMAPATAVLLYANYFTTREYLPPILAAAAGGTVIATISALLRWGPVTTLLLAVFGFAILGTYLLYPSTLSYGLPTLQTATSLGNGLTHGWARMLTISLPADVSGDLLAAPALLTWTAAVISTVLAFRTRAILAPVVAPLVTFVAALLLTASRGGASVVVTVAFLAELLLLVLVRVARIDTVEAIRAVVVSDTAVDGGQPTRPRVLGRIAFGIPVVILIAAAGVGGAIALPVAKGTHRFDPREVVPLRYNINDTLTPLVTLKSQLRENPPRKLFTVQVEGGSTGDAMDRVRTAALDSFDGAVWTSDDSFLVAGHTLPADPSLTNPHQTRVHIDITSLDGPYLPVIGWPVSTDLSGAGFSRTSGVLASNQPSLGGMKYDLVGEVRPRDDGLATAVPNLTSGSRRYTQLPPGLPAEVQAQGDELTSRVAQPYAKLSAIETYLRKLPYSLDARPGHSYDALRRLFSSNTQDRIGYAEQYAAAFAVLARSQGFPARVAVGYSLRPEDKRGNTYTVTTADAHAWAEVNFAGYGWVPFEPTNPNRNSSVQPPNEPQTPPGGENKPADQQDPGSQPIVDPHLKAGPGLKARVLAYALLVLAGLIALAIALPIAVIVEKVRRRSRRRVGSRASRIMGAWRETTDRLIEHGVGVPRSMTAKEVAALAEEQLGESAVAVGVLAPLVTSAVFCPAEPQDDQVREAWELHRRFRRDLRRGRGVLSVARAKFDPRPLYAGGRDRRRRRRTMEKLHGG